MTKYHVELTDLNKYYYGVEADGPAEALEKAESLHETNPNDPFEVEADDPRIFVLGEDGQEEEVELSA